MKDVPPAMLGDLHRATPWLRLTRERRQHAQYAAEAAAKIDEAPKSAQK